MKTIFPEPDEAPLELLRRCEGYYRCPKDKDGKRLGPLVGYAGKYDGEHCYVGDEYANFAKAERHGPVLGRIADDLYMKILAQNGMIANFCTGFCGAPEGGKALALFLAALSGNQYISPGKEVVAVKTDTSREASRLCFDRNAPEPGERWWIIEDVCNNFTTTQNLITLIERAGATVGGVACFLNRSPEIDNEYLANSGIIPVVSLVRKIIPEYRQSDPFVAEDIAKNNVVWKPKIQWGRLAKAMEAHR